MLKHILYQLLFQKMVRERKIFLWSVFITAAISRRQKKLPPLGIFARFNFFNTCEALALLSVNRFGCGFFLGFTFFTEYFSDNVFKVFHHTLRGELTMKFNNIWCSIIIFLERILPRFFQRWSLQMSCLRMWTII